MSVIIMKFTEAVSVSESLSHWSGTVVRGLVVSNPHQNIGSGLVQRSEVALSSFLVVLVGPVESVIGLVIVFLRLIGLGLWFFVFLFLFLRVTFFFL